MNIDEIKEATSIAKDTKEVLPETVNQCDKTIATLVGLVNNVLLYPIAKANLYFGDKIKKYAEELETRASQIPADKIKEPNISIVGPTIEALKYNLDEEELKEMYTKLLLSSMDSRKTNFVHPSYVEIIKKMDEYDAKLFKYLLQFNGYIKAINPKIGIKNTNRYYISRMPEWFINYENHTDVSKLSASLIRLSNLGIIDLMYDRSNGKEGYEELKNDFRLKMIFEEFAFLNPTADLELTITQSVVFVNDFGKQFARVCVTDK